jgi:peptidoglycan/LPS O-acetylase OafA/YrhL
MSIRASAFVDMVSGAWGTVRPQGATMSTSSATLMTAQSETQTTTSLRRTTIVAGLAAAGVTTAVAAAVHAAGVPFEIDGEMIPLVGFAQMTFLGAVIGGVIAAVLKRRSDVPAQRFVQITVALLALSCVPSVALPPDLATKVALVATHLVAAAIIVPVLARQLDD